MYSSGWEYVTIYKVTVFLEYWSDLVRMMLLVLTPPEEDLLAHLQQ